MRITTPEEGLRDIIGGKNMKDRNKVFREKTTQGIIRDTMIRISDVKGKKEN